MSTGNTNEYSISSASLLSIGSIAYGAAMKTRLFMARRWLTFALPMVLIVCGESALAQTYRATELGLLSGGTADAEAINNGGQVVGGADDLSCGAAVIWSGSTPTAMPTTISCTPPFDSTGRAVNNFGVVLVLESQIGSFVWSPTLYNVLGYDKFFLANAINDSGRIVGTEAIPFGGPPSVAISWASPYATTWTVLPQLPGNESGGAFAKGINNAGRVVGASILISFSGSVPPGTQHATLWSGETVTDLGTLGGSNSEADAIADSGQIVGWADTESGAQHAASWIGTKITDLGTLGGTSSFANAINASGEVVGAAQTSSGAQHAALFTGGKAMDLNSALSPSVVAYIMLTEATGINDSHLIVANGVDSRTGRSLAFLLSPNIEVLNCVPGNVPVFRVVNPSNFVSSNVSPNSSGNPSICTLPSSEPPTWYIKTTTDGGATWQWKYMLEALGLGELPSNLDVLNCVQGGNFYKVVKPSNSVSSNVSPNSAGNPSICAVPSSEPATWYIKTTTDGGATWQWKYMLEALGLGK